MVTYTLETRVHRGYMRSVRKVAIPRYIYVCVQLDTGELIQKLHYKSELRHDDVLETHRHCGAHPPITLDNIQKDPPTRQELVASEYRTSQFAVPDTHPPPEPTQSIPHVRPDNCAISLSFFDRYHWTTIEH